MNGLRYASAYTTRARQLPPTLSLYLTHAGGRSDRSQSFDGWSGTHDYGAKKLSSFLFSRRSLRNSALINRNYRGRRYSGLTLALSTLRCGDHRLYRSARRC